MAITAHEICRYPVKGLNAETLPAVRLEAGKGLPHDRRFALAPAASRFDPNAPCWLPKHNFLTLLKDERLALLRVRFDEETGMLTLLRGGKRVAGGRATEPMGRTLVEQFLGAFMPAGPRGRPKIVAAPGVGFTDCEENLVSLVNLASVADIERVARAPVDPRRFRANLYLAGAPAWAERDWVGRTLTAGEARLRVVAPIERCAATAVNPETATRDLNLPLLLERGFGHVETGVYAEVVGGGVLRRGDAVAVTVSD